MICAYTGSLGSGKTFSLIADTVRAFRTAPMDVYSSLSGLRCPEAIYIEALTDLPTLTRGRVLLDETGIYLSARDWQSVPKSVLQSFTYLRKNGLDLMWTAPTLDRVEKQLRDITQIEVRCRRIGRVIVQHVGQPGNKASYRMRLRKLDPAIFPLFDTMERKDGQGRTLAALEGGPRSLAARKRSEETQRLRGLAPNGGKVPLTWVLPFDNVLHMRRDAAALMRQLQHMGAWDDGEPWAEQIRAHARRRAWLRQWSLALDDAPWDCTYDNPWLAGSDPASVEARAADRRVQGASEEFIVSARARARKAAA